MTQDQTGIAALDERIPFLLSQLGAHIADEFKRRLESLGLHPRATAILLALAEVDGQSQRELSVRLGLHRNVMVAMVDALEEQGLVERLPHPTDRRAFAVSLTKSAREVLPGLDRVVRDLEDQITAPLSEGQRAALLTALQRMSAAAGLTPGVHPGLA
ncbi:MarR family transcriptional regulator [Mycobacterium sp. 852013-50091_SCH5140682]|uniref:MarR family winged helix-turn-helix transcriptional regulator n=1 Tax=Mycobacterium sp. 852013-50091_SCH5140682 TaxID=1834109 RepID=UPI0007EA23D5|nr:MarR family transcriptional regulator [Mycobacterium sp. 852013-50091_SCH5140682]OBC03239.1 MarR family transcriptional regulator [Mycobacterium sp. 852013-50091_SCH5140682]